VQGRLVELGHLPKGWRDIHRPSGEQEEDVGALYTVRDLGEQLLEDRARTLPLTGKEVQPRRLEAPAATRRRVLGWRQRCRELG
jgi:hypothetical protein